MPIQSIARFAIVAVVLLLPSLANADPIKVESVLLKLIARVETPAQESGVIAEVSAREGKHVRRGEVLVRMEDTEAQLAKQTAKIELAAAREEAKTETDIRVAEAAAAFATANYQRAKRAVADVPNAYSQEELESREFEEKKAKLELEKARREQELLEMAVRLKENAYEIATYKVERHMIKAPIDGVIVQIHRREGEWLQPGEKVVRILRMDRLRAEGYVDLQAISGASLDSDVTLTVDLAGRPDAQFPGKLVFISPEADPVNNQVLVWAEIENPDLVLQPGLRGSMTISSSVNE